MTNEENLVLNPTENFPMDSSCDYNMLEGMYVSNDTRNSSDNKIIFAGRNEYTKQLNTFKKTWCKYLKSDDIDFRYLSGLHAHIIAFMSLGCIGDSVLLLPEIAGGHFSTEIILKRLGYNIINAISDDKNYCVDKEKTAELIKKTKPKFAFIDRSEGIYYEDFSWMKDTHIPYCVFDGSQYLSQIICEIYPSPFNWGFDLILSSTHKNYPGPQKAFLATNKNDNYWKKLLEGSSTYISNSHPKDIFRVLESINNIENIKKYSVLLLEISKKLEMLLYNKGFPVVLKSNDRMPTQHIWARFNSKEECFSVFTNLERVGILVNYRLLPYNLGYGLRIGVGAAIQQGLRLSDVETLANIMAKCYSGYSNNLENEMEEFMKHIKSNGKLL